MPEVFPETPQWHSDKTAKIGFVGFDITYLGDYQEFFSVSLGALAL